MQINDVFERKDYTSYAIWANKNNAKIVKINNGLYQVIKVPAPTDDEKKQARILELKNNLTATDYKIIKIAEGSATKEEYAEDIAKRQAWRAEINSLGG